MLAFLELLLTAAALLLLLPVAVFFTEALSAVTQRTPAPLQSGVRGRIAILMPAHNEASMLPAALRAVAPQLHANDTLLVVADNCTDETARVAAAEGADTIERHDSALRGKGYALDFGIRHLSANPPDLVIIIDADCHATPGSIDTLARVCGERARPIQGLYLMHAGAGATPLRRIAEFAWIVKNRVRPLGLKRLGLPCQLMGTGMAFPWHCIANAALASGHIVEDLKLGIDLAASGHAPWFCADALVTSLFPATDEAAQNQRARWEHGYLSVVLQAPGLLWRALATRNLDLFIMALDLCVPPLALLMLQVATLWLACLSLYAMSARAVPLYLSSAALAMYALAVLLSWAFYGRHIVPLRNLALAALYALRKIPLYARFLVARQINWVRAKRDDE